MDDWIPISLPGEIARTGLPQFAAVSASPFRTDDKPAITRALPITFLFFLD